MFPARHVTSALPDRPTRAQIQAQRRAVAAAASKVDRRPARAPRRRTNSWLAIVAVVLVLVAAGLGVLAFLTYGDAQDTRDANRVLQTRVTTLRTELSSSDKVIDDLSALFIAIQAQNEATANAVTATNNAAAQYNSSESGIAQALGAQATDAVTALTQATAAVKTAAADAKAAIAALGQGQ
jgi:hypothetical protein